MKQHYFFLLIFLFSLNVFAAENYEDGIKLLELGDTLYLEEKYEFNIVFGCSPENVDTLTQALFTQIDSLQTYGIDVDYISKIQEKQKQAREIDLQENKFWLDYISSDYYHNVDPTVTVNGANMSISYLLDLIDKLNASTRFTKTDIRVP